MRAQPLIAVNDVVASSLWYAELLGAKPLGRTKKDMHDGIYNRLLDSDGRIVLQLHSWDDEPHPGLTDPNRCPLGHGHLLWFEVDDFDDMVERAYQLDAKIIEGPLVNGGPKHRELWLEDPDGYILVLASPDGEALETP